MTSGESTYGETHLGNVDVLSLRGEVIAVGKLSATKYLDESGDSCWEGHLTALAPPSVAQELAGEFALRFADGSKHTAVIEHQETSSQLSPGMEISVVGVGPPPF